MAKEFVVGDLQLKRPVIPLLVELGVLGMDESQFLVCKEQGVRL